MEAFPNDVPSEWDSSTLGDLAKKVLSGGTPSTKNIEYWRGDIQWITSKWLNEKLYLKSGEKTISKIGVKQSSTKIIPAGNLIFATRVGVGKVAINAIDLAINQDLAGILIDAEIILLEFLAYQLRTDRIQLYIEQNKRGATIKGITQACLKEINIVIPPPDEQKKIAAVLATVHLSIEQQEQIIEHTVELKKALMKKLFTEGTHGKSLKQTAIGLVPESWEVLELKQVVDYIDYGLSKAIPKTPPPDGVKIVSTADINRDGELLYDKIREIEAPDKTKTRLTLLDGDILFNWRNSLELIGKTAIFDKQPDPHIFASFILRIRCDEKHSHNYYLKHLLNHFRDEGVFVRLARRAVNQANYNKNEISELKIPVPPYREQVEIADRINLIEQKIRILKAQERTIVDLFRTLLQQLMTAKIRVNDIDLSELGVELEGAGT
jgi:type I restriction enzyme S subunit